MVDALEHPDTSQVETGFARRMLLSGLRAPEARSAMAARTLAGLIGLLAAEGVDREIAGWLAPHPGGDATFEVLTGPVAGSKPAESPPGNGLADRPAVSTGLDVGGALREASKLASAGPDQVAVVSVAPDGLRRTALLRDASEPFRFVYPEAPAFDGALDVVRQAVAEWELLAADPAGFPGRADPGLLSPAALTEAVREALADVMVEVDMVAVEKMVGDALRSALSSNQHGGSSPDGPSGWAGQAALVAAADQFHIVLESFNDRVRAGSRSLQNLADELATQERTAAAYTDQLARSVQASIDRLARRLDARFDELQRGSAPERDAPGEPASDE